MLRVDCHLEQCVEVQGCGTFPHRHQNNELNERELALTIERIAQAKSERDVFAAMLFSTRGFSPRVVRNIGGDIVVA
jgi:hypothetical protein